MDQNKQIIHHFYTAFQNLHYDEMQSCYHSEATFYDPVFQNLNAIEVNAMWKMLLTSAKDLKISFKDVHAEGTIGRCTWEAWYTFSKTGRPVHNVIHAEFEFKDGKIFRHRDTFNVWRWSKQALGFSGLWLGWSPIVKNKIRRTAAERLKKFLLLHA